MSEISHHAYLVRSTEATDVSLLIGDSEVVTFSSDQFGIADARAVAEAAYVLPGDRPMRAIVIQTTFVTHEAQNALLKILEEPPVTTKFILIVPPDCVVLDTILSRVVVHEHTVSTDSPVFVEFLSQTSVERLLAIEGATKRKDVAWMRSIKTGLVKYLATESVSITCKREGEFVARLLLTRGASNKMLLEHLALTLPT